MEKKQVCIGVAGAGRATELHMNALKRFCLTLEIWLYFRERVCSVHA